MLGEITIGWHDVIQYTPYVAASVIGLWLLKKILGPVVTGGKAAGNAVHNLASKMGPMSTLCTALAVGPIAAHILSQNYGSYGTVSALAPAGAISIFAMVSQIRRWAGYGTLGRYEIQEIKNRLEEAEDGLRHENYSHAASRIARAKETLTLT